MRDHAKVDSSALQRTHPFSINLFRTLAMTLILSLVVSGCDWNSAADNPFGADGAQTPRSLQAGNTNQTLEDQYLQATLRAQQFENNGRADYEAYCVECHAIPGELGGGNFVLIPGTASCRSCDAENPDILIARIADTMPPANVGDCGYNFEAGEEITDSCAYQTAYFMLAGYVENRAELETPVGEDAPIPDKPVSEAPGLRPPPLESGDETNLINLPYANEGQAAYEQYCLRCHGPSGEAPFPVDLFNGCGSNNTPCGTTNTLANYIGTAMATPNYTNGGCVANCAIETANYILAGYAEREQIAVPPPVNQEPPEEQLLEGLPPEEWLPEDQLLEQPPEVATEQPELNFTITQVFSEPNCSGTSIALKLGDNYNKNQLDVVNLDNAISCVIVASGETLIGYPFANNQGQPYTFTATMMQLPPEIDNDITSLEVMATDALDGQPASSCMFCHNGAKQITYTGSGIENPHPFAPFENMACVTCHGGNNQGWTKEQAHVPAPPQLRDPDNLNDPSISENRLANDTHAYWNRLTLSGMDQYEDYTFEGQTYSALDYLQFIQPSDLRVLNDSTQTRSCANCHLDKSRAVAQNPLGYEVGFFSGIGFSTGMQNTVLDITAAQQGQWSYVDIASAADYAYRGVPEVTNFDFQRVVYDPNYNFIDEMQTNDREEPGSRIGTVNRVEGVPTYGRFNTEEELILTGLQVQLAENPDYLHQFLSNEVDPNNYMHPNNIISAPPLVQTCCRL